MKRKKAQRIIQKALEYIKAHNGNKDAYMEGMSAYPTSEEKCPYRMGREYLASGEDELGDSWCKGLSDMEEILFDL